MTDGLAPLAAPAAPLAAPRTAIVTGGARRIGRAIVEDLVRNGWRVAIHCNRSREEAEAFAAAINGDGGAAAVVVGDLADPDGIASILPAAIAALGPVDLLVNNASIFERDEAAALDLAVMERHLRVNLTAPCLLASAFVEALPAGIGGQVINIIDQRVWKPTPQFFSYTMAKSALWAATRTMAQALAPRIRVNAIGPGPTLANVRQAPEDFARQAGAVLLRAGPELAEFGRTIRFLVETPSITGQMIALDGGQHLAWETPDVVGIEE